MQGSSADPGWRPRARGPEAVAGLRVPEGCGARCPRPAPWRGTADRSGDDEHNRDSSQKCEALRLAAGEGTDGQRGEGGSEGAAERRCAGCWGGGGVEEPRDSCG